jgi:hypothetical protein
MSSSQNKVSLYQSLGKQWLEINKMGLLRRLSIPTLFFGNIMIVTLKTLKIWLLKSYYVRSRQTFQ